MERVQSKNLFNNQLHGVVDLEIQEQTKKDMERFVKGFSADDDAAPEAVDMNPENLSCLEYAGRMRQLVDVFFKPMIETPDALKALESCIHTKFTVPPRDGNDSDVPVMIHTPKALESSKDRPAIIYAHGGGVISGSVELFKSYSSRNADQFGVVYFDVGYRLAPETKCPKNALDFYCAVKHIIEHAADYGVDPKRIAIAGDSGGGYIVMSTMVMLAQKDEGHLVKLAIPGIPMIDDYHFGDPKSMTKEEREACIGMRKAWECIAADIDEQRKNSDPLLFPAKADDELLAKMPPTIIWEVEFDMFITESTRMAARLRAAGRLLELYIAPGMNHGSTANLNLAASKKYLADYKLALETYLF